MTIIYRVSEWEDVVLVIYALALTNKYHKHHTIPKLRIEEWATITVYNQKVIAGERFNSLPTILLRHWASMTSYSV